MTYNLKLTNSLTRKKELFKPINLIKLQCMHVDQLFMTILMLEMQEHLVVFDTLYRLLK